MNENNNEYSYVVFPFLKTERSFSIGNQTFYSTENTDHLSAEQVSKIKEITGMLFLKDDFRIRSASYALIPYVNFNDSGKYLQDLANIQSVVAYLYATVNNVFGNLFLSSEHATMIILSPSSIPISLVRPDFHTEPIAPSIDLITDSINYTSGYAGLYNFRHYFWVRKGSRLYGPKPNMTLNISQDLGSDLERAMNVREDCRLLCKLLKNPETTMSTKILTAIHWFNAANNESNDDATAIINLAIAFESLLSLPVDNKTDRLIDAIALLLGRLPRLGIWAKQFYETRSRIIHEGHTERLNFIATDSMKDLSKNKKEDNLLYRPLLSYGREIFQLCLSTVLLGADLAKHAGLEEKFVTNQERFTQICAILSDQKIEACEQLKQIAPIVAAIEQYRFVSESGLKINTLLGSIRLAAKAIISCDCDLEQEVKVKLKTFIDSKRTKNNHLDELDAIKVLSEYFPDGPFTPGEPHIQTVRVLVQIVWGYFFMYYFVMKEHEPTNETKK